jgi:hypothetical protein
MRQLLKQQSIAKVPDLVRRLYGLVKELERSFNRKFTPDGHMVGSLGEVIVGYAYGLDLLPQSYQGHDARALDGRWVQIKATQGRQIALRSQPQHLIVIGLLKDGTWEEIYNGPGILAWNKAGRKGSNGQKPVSVSQLRKLMKSVLKSDKLPKVREPEMRAGPISVRQLPV